MAPTTEHTDEREDMSIVRIGGKRQRTPECFARVFNTIHQLSQITGPYGQEGPRRK